MSDRLRRMWNDIKAGRGAAPEIRNWLLESGPINPIDLSTLGGRDIAQRRLKGVKEALTDWDVKRLTRPIKAKAKSLAKKVTR